MGVQRGGERPPGDLRKRAEEVREVQAARRLHGEDAEEACDEGREAGDLRKGRGREGEASKDGGEVLLRCAHQETLLTRLRLRRVHSCARSSPSSWGRPRGGALRLAQWWTKKK